MTESSSAAEQVDLLNAEFPIPSQTSPSDKMVLLQVRKIADAIGFYSYCEIGSFLGGSLTPFLRDSKCQAILSVDERERQQPDERGMKYDYGGITNQTMLDNLTRHGLDIGKLQTFDGSIDRFEVPKDKFDLLFIDGEHTDFACFRDFVHGIRLLKENAIILFHDSGIVYKALRNIQEYLRAGGYRFSFIKVKDSEMSLVFLGDYSDDQLTGHFQAEGDLEGFYRSAEATLITSLIQNRVSFTVNNAINFTVKDMPTSKVAT